MVVAEEESSSSRNRKYDIAESLWRRVCRKDSLQRSSARTRCKKKACRSPPHIGQLRLSRFLRPGETDNPEEKVPLRRTVFWVVVWLGILLGILLYFKYARHLVPMLA